MEKIFNLIDTYSRNKKLLDEKAMKEIIESLLVINNACFNYDIIFCGHFHFNTYKNALIYFNYRSFIIFVDRIKKFLLDDKSRKTRFLIEDELDNYEEYLFKNVYILRMIMHEMEHFLQFENKLEQYSDIEKRLLLIEDEFMLELETSMSIDKNKEKYKYLNRLYNENDCISFNERISEIYAIEKTNDFLEDYIEKTEKIIDINNLFLLNAQMVQYLNDSDSPTERFFNNIGKSIEFHNLDLSNLSYGERLRYGLKLEPKEYFDNMSELTLTKKERK